MALVGEVLHAETDCFRINYEILGNSDAALHAHIFPRYEWEQPDKRVGPVWWYSSDERTSEPFDADVHGALMARLRSSLKQRSPRGES
jgi:diadenosine tetraphosphate (Ap4A) HIT family hydrolase